MPEVLRESQARILSYTGGKMGISAVPGSGKTWTLSRLAAKLISTAELQPDQEVLVVTFSNSAVDNFSTRIGQLLRQSGVLSGLGYHVRTLHGLANDIIHQRPELAGLTNDYQILDQTEADAILTHSVDAWLKLNPHFFDDLLLPSFISPDSNEHTKKADELLSSLIKSVGLAFIRTAKDLRLTPIDITKKLKDYPMDTSLIQMGLALYQDYQAALNYRGAIDFDDLIWLAYQCYCHLCQQVGARFFPGAHSSLGLHPPEYMANGAAIMKPGLGRFLSTDKPAKSGHRSRLLRGSSRRLHSPDRVLNPSEAVRYPWGNL